MINSRTTWQKNCSHGEALDKLQEQVYCHTCLKSVKAITDKLSQVAILSQMWGDFGTFNITRGLNHISMEYFEKVMAEVKDFV